MRNTKLEKKFNYFYVLKSLFLIFSLILVIVILAFYKEPTSSSGGASASTSGSGIIFLLIIAILLISTLTLLTLKEYRSYIIRKSYIQQGNSYLKVNDIFENENRINLIKKILRNPGIHHNELLRRCDMHNGQLQWHLDVLLKNNIIKKEKNGQYTIYFPITTSFNAIEYLETLIAKSKTTSKILKIIKENPRINSSEISRILSLSRNTIKYHIDKLSKENLIILTRRGRKIELYPIL